jgi:MerR family redox-sensitive transcriptional activator SoxR
VDAAAAKTLTIGQLAADVGLNTSAIRYYERVGVLPPAARAGGRRRYGADAVRRLQLLEVVKRTGFSLDEARVLLERDAADAAPAAALREIAEAKLPEIDALIARATAVRAWLAAARACHCKTLDVCTLFEAGEASCDDAPAPARALAGGIRA